MGVLVKTETAVISLGVLLVLMAALSTLKIAVNAGTLVLADLLLAAAFLSFLHWPARQSFRRDYKRYLLFFSLWFVIVQLAFFTVLLFNPLEIGPWLFVGLVVALVALSASFRLVLGKNIVEGKVILSDSESAAVELGFDLFAGLNSGKYVVQTSKKYKKGELVRVALKRKFFRRVPAQIVGKSKK